MEAGHLLKATDTKIEGSQRQPLTNLAMGHTIVEQDSRSTLRDAEPGGGKGDGKTPLTRAQPDFRIWKGPGQGRQRQLVLEPGGGGQNDRAHRPMLLLEFGNRLAQLTGRRQGIHQHQATGHLGDSEANRNRHVIDPLQLLKAPELAGDQLTEHRAAAAIGIQRQQRPPGPALISRLDAGSNHAVQVWHPRFCLEAIRAAALLKKASSQWHRQILS